MAERQIQSLVFAVRGRVVLKIFGQLSVVLALLTLVVLAFAVLSGDIPLALRYAVVVGVLGFLGLSLGRMRAPSNLEASEALVITALVFMVSPLLLAYPMTASGLSYGEALFEAISAVTTTGLSTLQGVEEKPRTFLFARAWMQWIGGLGIVVFTVALLLRPSTAARQFLDLEETEDIIGGTRVYARRVLAVYVVLTAGGIVMLMLGGENAFSSIIHALAAVSTGGFSGYDGSIAGMEYIAPRLAVTCISLAGAFSLILYYTAASRGWRRFPADVEVRALLLFVAGLSLVLWFLMSRGGGPEGVSPLNAILLAVSAQTTTGFAPVDVAGLPEAAKLVVVIAMAVGGSIGSTAGGMKVYRVLLFFSVVRFSVIRPSLPDHAVAGPRLAGRNLESPEIQGALMLLVLYVAVVILSWLPFVAVGYDPLDSLFEVVSATSTVGLSSGITGPELPALLKAILCADMLMGRLEFLAFLVVVYPNTWFGRRSSSS